MTRRTATPHPRMRAAQWLTAPETVQIFDVIEKAGFAVRVVGGTVRNTLLDEPVSDIDLATTATPDAVIEAATRAGLKVIPTGFAHGTVTVVVSGIPFEVTTLRRDVSTDGRRATVAFTKDWAEDAARRDFTINAIYCDRRGVLLDPVDGLADIERRRVRFIGDARERIREDYLRILRFFRFSATYAKGTLDADGLAACIDERGGMARLSAERIHHELMRILAAPHALPVVSRMTALGFLHDILGTEPDLATFSALSELELRPCDPLLGLVSLAIRSEDDIEQLRDRLRLSNAETSRMTSAIRAATLIGSDWSEAGTRACIYRLGATACSDGLKLAMVRGEHTPTDPRLTRLHALTQSWTPPRLPISGSDVLAGGVPPGPRVAEVLHRFETWWIEQDYPDDRDTIAAKLAELIVVTKP